MLTAKTLPICLFLGWLLSGWAHMEMSYPYPLRSRLDPLTPGDLRDYDNIAPLRPDGSDFPCKNYHGSAPWRPVATYVAGGSYTMSVTGGARHHGGSCQLSLSYDQGATFKVIKSIVGGCPLKSEYAFTVPASAPSGPALFAWSWFNLMGNREMYMNCAQVVIEGGSLARSASANASAGLEELPEIFVANVGAQGRCTTTETEQLIFPEPGPEIEYGAGLSPSDPVPAGPCGPRSSKPASYGGQRSTSLTRGRPTATGVSVSSRVGTLTRQSSPSAASLSANPSLPVSGSSVMPPGSSVATTYRCRGRTCSSNAVAVSTPSSSVPSRPTTTGTLGSMTSRTATASSFTQPMPPPSTAGSSEAVATPSTRYSSPIASGVPPMSTSLSPQPPMLSQIPLPPQSAPPASSSQQLSSAPSPTSSQTSPTPASALPSLQSTPASPQSPLPPSISTGLSSSSLLPSQPQASPSSSATGPPRPVGTTAICQPGDIQCTSADAWCICDGYGTGFIFMGAVAPGTACIDGKILPAPRYPPATGGLCSGDVPLRCVADASSGGSSSSGCTTAFEVCSQGVWIYMGSVAAGTVCQDGQIIAAPVSP